MEQVQNQPLNITGAWPDRVVTVTPAQIDQNRQVITKSAMVFSAEVGMSAMLLLVIFAITRPEKRRTIVFAMNCVSLVMSCVRGILQIMYYDGGWSHLVVQTGVDFRLVHQRDFNNSMAAACMPIFIVLACELSLLFQMRIIYAAHERARFMLTIFCGILSFITTSLWIVSAIMNCFTIQSKDLSGNATLWGTPWYYQTARLLFAFTICFYSAILLFKLFQALRLRHRLGLRSFGPMQVITIMACQSMVVPAVFTIVDFAVDFNGFSSITQCVTIFSLPLTSMWASAQAADTRGGSRHSGIIKPRRMATGSSFSMDGSDDRNDAEFGSPHLVVRRVHPIGQPLDTMIMKSSGLRSDSFSTKGVSTEPVRVTVQQRNDTSSTVSTAASDEERSIGFGLACTSRQGGSNVENLSTTTTSIPTSETLSQSHWI